VLVGKIFNVFAPGEIFPANIECTIRETVELKMLNNASVSVAITLKNRASIKSPLAGCWRSYDTVPTSCVFVCDDFL